MKIYAKQVNPEYQDSCFEDTEYSNIIITGNRDYKGIITDLYDRILNCYDELYYEIDKVKTDQENSWYKNITEAINDYFPPLEYRNKPYSTKDIHNITEALNLYGTRKYYDGDYIIDMLSAITGRKWDISTIRGCSQGEWNYIYYPIDEYTDQDIYRIEVEYFNTGSEWIIDDNNYNPETDKPEDINGYSIYCTSYSDENIRQEIANCEGCSTADIVLFAYDGYNRIDKYREVV